MTHVTPTTRLNGFRFAEPSNPSSPTFKAAENTNVDINDWAIVNDANPHSNNMHLYVQVSETAGADVTPSLVLEQRTNGGTWFTVTNSPTNEVHILANTDLTDGNTYTAQLSGGGGAGTEQDENASISGGTLNNNSYEMVFSVTLRGGQGRLLHNETVEFRITDGGTALDFEDNIALCTIKMPQYDGAAAFRFRNDDGSETAATWKAALNTDINQPMDENFRLRLMVDETRLTGDLGVPARIRLQYRINAGAWTTVTATSAVQFAASSNFAHDAVTTQQLGSGSFVAGRMVENDTNPTWDFVSNEETEFEWCLQLDSGQISASDVIEFRASDFTNGSYELWTQSPAVTATAPATVLDQDSYRFRNDNGSETTATWRAAANTIPSVNVQENFRLRFLLQETAGVALTGGVFKLQHNINSAGWVDTGTDDQTDGVGVLASSNFADGDATTQQIGAGSFTAGQMLETDGTSNSQNIGASGETEIEINARMQPVNGVVNGAPVQFRLIYSDDSLLDTYTNTAQLAIRSGNYDQDSFRFRNDDGNETTATWKAAANTNVSLDRDTPFRLRFLVQNGGDYYYTVTQDLQFRINGGAWTAVTGTSAVQYSDSANFTNGDNTTQQIGAGTFGTSRLKDTTGTAAMVVQNGQEGEPEFCLTLDSGQVSAGDTVEIRLYEENRSQAYGSYTNTPSISVPPEALVDNASHAHSADNVTMTPHPVMVIADGVHSHAADNVDNVFNPTATPDASVHSHVAGSPTITADAAAAPDAATHGHTSESPSITPHAVIATADALHSHTAEQPTVTPSFQAAPDDATHSHVSDNVTLAAYSATVVADAQHGHVADNVIITPLAVIAVDAGVHSHIADNVVNTFHAPVLTADGVHSHIADNAVMVPHPATTVSDSQHGHVAESPTVTPLANIVSAAGIHAHIAEEPTISTAVSILTDDAQHSHIADNLTITADSVVVPADSLHAHTAEQPVVAAATPIETADAQHSHVADSPTIAPLANIVAADGLHSHTAEQPNVTTATAIEAADASHALTSDNVTLVADSAIAPDAATHSHVASNPAMAAYANIFPNDSFHALSSDSPTIAPLASIVPADSLHSHSADNVILAATYIVAPDDAVHAHTADSPIMAALSAVTIDDSLHAHTAGNVTIVAANTIKKTMVFATAKGPAMVLATGRLDAFPFATIKD